MMGPKKLRTIREDLHRALGSTGQDPIRWLDQRLAAGKESRIAASSEKEVLQSLRRFLRSPVPPERGRKPVVTKTGESPKNNPKGIKAIR